MKQSNEPEIQRKIKALFILFEAKTKIKSKTKSKTKTGLRLLIICKEERVFGSRQV